MAFWGLPSSPKIERLVNCYVALSAYVPETEDKRIVVPYVPSHLHHMMFELMKVSIVFQHRLLDRILAKYERFS